MSKFLVTGMFSVTESKKIEIEMDASSAEEAEKIFKELESKDEIDY